MLLSHKTTVKINNDHANIIGHMCYAAYKLWNVCNYERMHYKELGIGRYPDWYYQKSVHKDEIWYKQLPSQTAQEVCKLLDKSWKSFYALKKTGRIENPNPPGFKANPMVITYMQNAIAHDEGSDTVRLSIPKGLKTFMSLNYGIYDTYLFLKNKIFKDIHAIKQIKVYPPEDNECRLIVIYEIFDTEMLPGNGRCLSVDLGLHNLMTCYSNTDGETFIAGRKYLSICRYYDREIGRVQSQWYSQQDKKGVKHFKSSKHIKRLHEKKKNTINDYLHKLTREIVFYCVRNDIRTVVIGDITNIRKDNDMGHKTNQKFHALPYKKLYTMLEYKLKLNGIRFVMQNEAYSSQTSPFAVRVAKENAIKSNRIKRGLYRDGMYEWNADCVGAYNILRLYKESKGTDDHADPLAIRVPYVRKVAV